MHHYEQISHQELTKSKQKSSIFALGRLGYLGDNFRLFHIVLKFLIWAHQDLQQIIGTQLTQSQSDGSHCLYQMTTETLLGFEFGINWRNSETYLSQKVLGRSW